VKIIWIESILKDEALIERNIRAVKINYPDYNNVDPYEVPFYLNKRLNKINEFRPLCIIKPKSIASINSMRP